MYCLTRQSIARIKKDLRIEINYKIPYNVIKLIKKKNIRFIHFSSEAVFEGKVLNKTYNENSIARPRSIYGKTKLKADKCVMAYKNGVVVRIPLLFWPYSQKSNCSIY